MYSNAKKQFKGLQLNSALFNKGHVKNMGLAYNGRLLRSVYKSRQRQGIIRKADNDTGCPKKTIASNSRAARGSSRLWYIGFHLYHHDQIDSRELHHQRQGRVRIHCMRIFTIINESTRYEALRAILQFSFLIWPICYGMHCKADKIYVRSTIISVSLYF